MRDHEFTRLVERVQKLEECCELLKTADQLTVATAERLRKFRENTFTPFRREVRSKLETIDRLLADLVQHTTSRK